MPGRQDEATIREPGDLPSAVSTRQTRVGVYPWMIQRTIQVFWSSLAPTAGMRGYFVLTFLKSAVDDASADQRPKIIAIYALLLAANAAVWTWAVIAFAGRPTLLGTAFLAYVLGLRHAVDADHIAAIDNVVRKLMQEGKRPV